MSCRLTQTSRISIRIDGGGRDREQRADTPNSAAPVSAAITVTAPGMSTDFDITRG